MGEQILFPFIFYFAKLLYLCKRKINDMDKYIFTVMKNTMEHKGRTLSKEEIMANRCSKYEFLDFSAEKTLREKFQEEIENKIISPTELLFETSDQKYIEWLENKINKI